MENKIVKILSNTRIVPEHYKLVFEDKALSGKILPGQFIHIKLSGSTDPLLRRPFSIFNIDKDRIEVLYRVIGRGTELLSGKIPGDVIDVIAPLGNTFNIPKDKETVNVLVAGGMGIAPLHALALELVRLKRKTIIFLGAKSRKFIICESELKRLGVDVRISTDDGSEGRKGFVTDELKRHLPKLKVNSKIFTCGPHIMMEEVARLAKSYGVQCEVSLEERMACGIGACMGCSVLTRSGYKNVCSDGPVFDAKEIKWQ